MVYPPEYIKAARRVLRTIDLDPASNEVAQRVVRAGRYFTAEDDGLTREWGGTVWLNPPYSRKLMGRFVSKLVAEVTDKRVTSAILLANSHSDTGWFHEADSACSAVCFTYGPDGTKAAPTQGQVFFYYGPNIIRFRHVLASIGIVVERRAMPRGTCAVCTKTIRSARVNARHCSPACRQAA